MWHDNIKSKPLNSQQLQGSVKYLFPVLLRKPIIINLQLGIYLNAQLDTWNFN